MLPLLLACIPELPTYTLCTSNADNTVRDYPPAAAELLVPNVDLGVEWYRDIAGFDLLFNAADTESCFAELALGDAHVLLSHSAAPFEAPPDVIELRYLVDDVDAQLARMDDAELIRDLQDEPYGLRDFVVRDVYGFRVRFAAPI